MNVTENMPKSAFIAAVFIFGDYPQVPWKDAVKRLANKVKYIAGQDEISPTAIFILGRKLIGKDFVFL